MNKNAVVVGAGLGGLACGIRLAAKGCRVHIFESNAYAGGKATEYILEKTQNGQTLRFRFDAGPSLFTLPEVFDDVFKACGKDPRDYFTYETLDETCRYFYEDGTRLTAWANAGAFAEEIEKKTTDKGTALLQYLQRIQEIYAITADVFLYHSLHKLATYLRWSTLRSFLRLHRIRAFVSMHRANKASFRDPKMVQLFDRYATYNGSNPFRAPGTLGVAAHLEYHYGSCMPHGGIHSLTRALVKLAEDMGVQIHYNEPVEEILVNANAVYGVRTSQQVHAADLVVSNMDVYFTYRKLLPHFPAPEKILRQEKSTSALVFYWGVARTFDMLGVHNILFSKSYATEFNALEAGEIDTDPTVYIHCTSKVLPGDAPEGMENWFVMINVPRHSGQNWEEVAAGCRANILQKINRMLGENIEPSIVAERILTPQSIESLTSSFGGALYGNASNSMFAAFLRHSNFSSAIRNLYFVGGSVHPGGGMPLVLNSARIVSDLIK